MQLSLIAIGTTSQTWVKDGVEMYNTRASQGTVQLPRAPNLKEAYAGQDA